MKKHHPKDRAERQRISDLKSIKKPKKINVKKKLRVEELKSQEATDEIGAVYQGDLPWFD